MIATLTLADTPQGISAELRWEGNDVTDHLADSISMALMAQFTETIKAHAKVGAIHLEKE
jgi:hypothetical protein